MADCNPPDPPPLLKEPFRKLPTAADRNAADRAEWEREQDSFWGDTAPNFVTGRPWGCVVPIAVAFATACCLSGEPLPLMPLMGLLSSPQFLR